MYIHIHVWTTIVGRRVDDWNWDHRLSHQKLPPPMHFIDAVSRHCWGLQKKKTSVKTLHAKNGLDDHSRTRNSMVGTFCENWSPFWKGIYIYQGDQKKSLLIPASVMNNLSSQLEVGVVEIPLLTGPKQNWTASVIRMATSQNGWLTSLSLKIMTFPSKDFWWEGVAKHRGGKPNKKRFIGWYRCYLPVTAQLPETFLEVAATHGVFKVVNHPPTNQSLALESKDTILLNTQKGVSPNIAFI